jgi:hypothetical protein
MYDHNQTLVPDSFMVLYSANGRPVLSREETEARYEICEDLALHTAAFLSAHDQGPDDADEALRRCDDGLRVEPTSVSAAEAAWVTQRVAELQDWPRPKWLAEHPKLARP